MSTKQAKLPISKSIFLIFTPAYHSKDFGLTSPTHTISNHRIFTSPANTPCAARIPHPNTRSQRPSHFYLHGFRILFNFEDLSFHQHTAQPLRYVCTVQAVVVPTHTTPTSLHSCIFRSDRQASEKLIQDRQSVCTHAVQPGAAEHSYSSPAQAQTDTEDVTLSLLIPGTLPPTSSPFISLSVSHGV